MTKKIGRNDPCNCGSGKKYKKCCLVDLKPQKSLYEKFEETGLIGCCSVEENLSTSYKEILANTLVTKYDHR